MDQFPKLVGDRYPTSRLFNLAIFPQVVKSVVKTFCWCFFEKGNIRKIECLQGLSDFLKTHGEKLPARSQTARATNCATPRCLYIMPNHAYAVNRQFVDYFKKFVVLQLLPFAGQKCYPQPLLLKTNFSFLTYNYIVTLHKSTFFSFLGLDKSKAM